MLTFRMNCPDDKSELCLHIADCTHRNDDHDLELWRNFMIDCELSERNGNEAVLRTQPHPPNEESVDANER